jgi:glycosyltransferase involved in cell wall biosynthesis
MVQCPASVVIITHNRKDLLYQSLKAVESQSLYLELILMDDASDDGTDVMIAEHFKSLLYYRSQRSMGPCWQRNEGAKRATSNIIVFLDDDTILQDQNTIKDVIADFDTPNVGAVSIPFINILQNKEVQAAAPDKNKIYILHAFVAAAFAIRRNIFFQIGGFREIYFYMGEEGDLCIRLLQKGYLIKAGTTSPAYHYQPSNRISFKADFFGRRNDILFLYLNSPRLYLVPAILGTIVKGAMFGIRVKRFKNMIKGIFEGLKLIWSQEVQKQVRPVKKDIFLKYRYLKKNEPLSIEEL